MCRGQLHYALSDALDIHMKRSSINLIDPKKWTVAVEKLRHFFKEEGFLEVPVQHRLSILAACEDPRTIGSYSYAGETWPLPQTGQMWLEYELLRNPDIPGYYCVSTSYRNEPKPIPGRHDLIFPMFEFETHGDMEKLRDLESRLLESIGFGSRGEFAHVQYRDAAQEYAVKEIEAEQEAKLYEDHGPVVFLSDFPQYTSPFWNMKKDEENAKKIDVLLYGVETIGSAERSCDPDEMRELFHTISDGMYADILYSRFTKYRVERELDEFLSFDFFPRCGGGIGMTRMINALKFANVIKS